MIYKNIIKKIFYITDMCIIFNIPLTIIYRSMHLKQICMFVNLMSFDISKLLYCISKLLYFKILVYISKLIFDPPTFVCIIKNILQLKLVFIIK